MKLIIMFMALSLANITLAGEIPSCNAKAHEAAYNEYIEKFGEAILFTKSKFKPMSDDTYIVQMIEIQDSDKSFSDILTVTMNKKTCKVLSVN